MLLAFERSINLVGDLQANGRKTVTVGLISNTHREFGNLMQSVALAFGVHFKGKDKVELYQDFTDFLVHEYAAGRRSLLILDEAQNLDAETLEEVRLLTNINADDHTLLQLLLVGQSELQHLLKRRELRQLAQRINVMEKLGPLDEKETVNYVRHRLFIAGGDPKLFHKNALRLIFWNSRGVPRVINALCELALVRGFTGGRSKIHAPLIADIVHDRAATGVYGDLVYDLDTLATTDKANALEAAARRKSKMLDSRLETMSQAAVVEPEIRRVGRKANSVPLEDSEITEIELGPLRSTA